MFTRRIFIALISKCRPSFGTLAVVLSAAVVVLCPDRALTQERTSFFTQDNAVIYADLYGTGTRGVVLAHGGQFNKESWREQARILVAAGFRVLAIDFRGYGQSRDSDRSLPPAEDARHLDVMAAVEYLRRTGATTVSVVGASMGGDYAADAAEATPAKIDRLVLLAAGAYTPLIKSKARKLFIMSRDDIIGDNTPRLPAIRGQYEKASGPKAFVVLDGSAHAQFIFATSQGNRLAREILRFLSAP
jgi:pimeloyl-ACP methyl ester carboxylesterase